MDTPKECQNIKLDFNVVNIIRKFFLFVLTSWIVIAFLHINYASAKTWYVRPAGSGVSVKDGATCATGWEGLSTIVWDSIGAGDTILLCKLDGDPAMFTETMILNASGSEGNPIVIRSENASSPHTIGGDFAEGDWPTWDDPSFNYGAWGIISARSSTLHDITIKDINILQCQGLIMINVMRIKIQNLYIYQTRSGLEIRGPTEDILIDSCRVDKFRNGGITFNGYSAGTGGSNSTIQNSITSNSITGDGIVLHDYNTYRLGDNFWILNNVASYNQEQGIDISSGNNVIVQGNETHHNDWAGIAIGNSASNVQLLRNYSHDEQGTYISPQTTGVITMAYNVFNTNSGKAALFVRRGKADVAVNIYNNVFRTGPSVEAYSSLNLYDDTVANLTIKNNIFAVHDSIGFFKYADNFSAKNIVFSNNLWFHPSGIDAKIWKNTKDGLSYNFTEFQNFENINDTLFNMPFFQNDSGSYKLLEDFALQPISSAINSGINVDLTQDIKGTFVPQGSTVDIGAYEYKSPLITAPQNLSKKDG